MPCPIPNKIESASPGTGVQSKKASKIFSRTLQFHHSPGDVSGRLMPGKLYPLGVLPKTMLAFNGKEGTNMYECLQICKKKH
jgi:hypothetical protein